MIPLKRGTRVISFVQMEHRRAVTRGWGRKEGVFSGDSVSLWGDDKFWRGTVVMAVPC